MTKREKAWVGQNLKRLLMPAFPFPAVVSGIVTQLLESESEETLKRLQRELKRPETRHYVAFKVFNELIGQMLFGENLLAVGLDDKGVAQIAIPRANPPAEFVGDVIVYPIQRMLPMITAYAQQTGELAGDGLEDIETLLHWARLRLFNEYGAAFLARRSEEQEGQ